jgi:hypothetical protein
MADNKTQITPETDQVLTPNGDIAVTSEPASAFKSDDFLASAKTSSPTPKAGSSATSTPAIKRGGIGFFTALVMSTLATAGGAYLALFVQARPEMLTQAGLGVFLPKTAPTPSLGTSGVNIEPLAQRVSAIEAELLVLKTKLEGNSGNTTPTTTPQIGTLPAPTPPTGTLAAPPPAPNTALAEVGTMKSELAGIGGRVTAIETRLAALDPTGAGGAVIAGLQADIAGLKSIVAALQQQAAAAPSPAVTFAVVNLAEAAGRSGPFLTEFETVRTAMPNVPEVMGLESYARTGVPTRSMLQERFSALGPAIEAATEVAPKEGGFVVWIRSLFSDMIKVKPAPNANGNGNGNGSEAVLGRAKAKLDQGDLSGSTDELATLQNPPALVTEWIGLAKKRIDLESRISAVRGAVGRPTAIAVAAPVAPIVGTLPSALPVPVPPAPITAPKTQGATP